MAAAEKAEKVTEKAAVRAEEVAKKAGEAAAAAARAAEEAGAKAEAAIPAALVRKVIASWEFKLFMIIILLASIMGAVSISLGLSLWGR